MCFYVCVYYYHKYYNKCKIPLVITYEMTFNITNLME